MDLALAIAQSGLEAQHKNLEIISNNLANANTTAFKGGRAEFQDLPYDVQKMPGSATSQDTNSPTGLVMGTGSKLIGTSRSFVDGSPVITGRALDMAISGRGFFQVQLPNGGGFAYTRAGNFKLNETSQITTPDGYVIQPAITVPQGILSFNVSQDGIVSVTTASSSTPQQIGQIQLADFINPDGLQPIGQNLYLETQASGTATLSNADQNGYGKISQNMLEGSNVSVVEEMVNLIEAQRSFEVTTKAVSAADNMMENLNRTS